MSVRDYAAAEITFVDRDSNERTAYTYPVTKVTLRERDHPEKGRTFIANEKGEWEEDERTGI